MTVKEFCEKNPHIKLEDVVHELIEWREKALKYRDLFMREVEMHAMTRKELHENSDNRRTD